MFDSGLGGLTVLQELRQVAPACDYVYVADHAFCPYGTKPPSEIAFRVVQIADFLKRLGAQSLVVACNTASVFSQEIRSATRIPVLDVIAPTCNFVAFAKYKKVALLATRATVQSGAYQQRLNRMGIETLCWNCSSLVPLVESGASEEQRLNAVAECLRGLLEAKAEAVILGCTHFPFLAKEISLFCGDAQIVSCGRPVATEFARRFKTDGHGSVRCFTTGNAEIVNAAAQRTGYKFSHIEI